MSDRWVEETFHPNWRVRLKADEVLHELRSEHHHLVVFKNKDWGTVMTLDGVVQLSTFDEYVYHEMMAHVPLMAHAKPKSVLVIGGGDGGVLREVLKHPSVKQAVLVDIDETVINLAKKYFPKVPDKAFKDARSEIVIADGAKFVATTGRRFDAVIVDSSEPIGPSAVLHSKPFFKNCRRVLNDGGVLVAQNGLVFTDPGHLGRTTRYLASMFKSVTPYACHQPCYFGGPLAINFASDDKALAGADVKTLRQRQKQRKIGDLKYWTPDVHRAGFALPAFAEAVVEKAIAKGRAA